MRDESDSVLAARAFARRPTGARGAPRPSRRPDPRGLSSRRRPSRGRARRHPGGDDRGRAWHRPLRRSGRVQHLVLPGRDERRARRAAAEAAAAGPRPSRRAPARRDRPRDRGPGRRAARRRRRRCARSPTTSGSRSCCATCATSTTRRSPRCSTCRPGRSARGSPAGARSSWNDWTRRRTRRATRLREPRALPRTSERRWLTIDPTISATSASPRGSRSEPLDELTRRRLVTSAMQASADAPSPAASQRAWRWIATAALIVVVLVAALALFTAQSGNEAQLSDAGKALGQSRDRIQPASPSIAATRPPVDVGDFGDLDTPANLRRLRTALEHARSAAVAPSNGGVADPDAGAETTANQLSTSACRDQLPAGTVTAVGIGHARRPPRGGRPHRRRATAPGRSTPCWPTPARCDRSRDPSTGPTHRVRSRRLTGTAGKGARRGGLDNRCGRHPREGRRHRSRQDGRPGADGHQGRRLRPARRVLRGDRGR